MKNRLEIGRSLQLDKKYIKDIFNLIHNKSVKEQINIINKI